MLSMAEVKKHLSEALAGLGYTHKVRKFVYLHFELESGLECEVEINSANAKRFEVIVRGEHADFLTPPRQQEDGQWYVVKRFHKSPPSIPEVLGWLASVKKSHSHLHAVLHPDDPLPEPYSFAAGGYMVDDDGNAHHGMVGQAKVEELVSVTGRKLTKTPYDPGHKPYLLMQVWLRKKHYQDYGQNFTIMTDGDIWYPVREFKDHKIVFPDHRVVGRLKTMNQNDKALIHEAVRAYVKKNFNDTESDTKPAVQPH